MIQDAVSGDRVAVSLRSRSAGVYLDVEAEEKVTSLSELKDVGNAEGGRPRSGCVSNQRLPVAPVGDVAIKGDGQYRWGDYNAMASGATVRRKDDRRAVDAVDGIDGGARLTHEDVSRRLNGPAQKADRKGRFQVQRPCARADIPSARVDRDWPAEDAVDALLPGHAGHEHGVERSFDYEFDSCIGDLAGRHVATGDRIAIGIDENGDAAGRNGSRSRSRCEKHE